MPDLHDLVAAYALDALDDHERDDFERHLQECESCVVELRELTEATTQIAFEQALTPPPSLKGAVMAAIDSEGSVVTDLGAVRRNRMAMALTAVAAGLAIVFAGLWAVANTRLSDAERVAAVYEAADSRVVDVETSFGDVRFVYSASLGEGVLSGANLIELDSSDVYELWLITDGPVPAGTLDAGQTLFLDDIPDGAVLAMTVEPAPGSDAPTSDPLFAEQL